MPPGASNALPVASLAQLECLDSPFMKVGVPTTVPSRRSADPYSSLRKPIDRGAPSKVSAQPLAATTWLSEAMYPRSNSKEEVGYAPQ